MSVSAKAVTSAGDSAKFNVMALLIPLKSNSSTSSPALFAEILATVSSPLGLWAVS